MCGCTCAERERERDSGFSGLLPFNGVAETIMNLSACVSGLG